MSTILEKMKVDMELRGFSPKTKKAYQTQVSLFTQHFNKGTVDLGQKEIREYLHYCTIIRHFSESHLNIIYSSLKFLYQITLNRDWNIKAIPRTKIYEKLPEILSREEIKSIFATTTNLKHRAILMTIYGGGLRVSEAASLMVSGIDSKNMQILLLKAKGKKDRYTLLSKQNLNILRQYYKQYKPLEYLFPGANKNKPITERSIQRVFTDAKIKAGIKKKVSVHTLRHCFATHLLEQGTNLCYIQQLMGHASIHTTMIYLHLRRLDILNVVSPLDKMEDQWIVELQYIFRIHGEKYRLKHKLPLNQLKAMSAIEACRTAELGGHIEQCDECGHIRIFYNSCRNSHCPKCQYLKKKLWLEDRKTDLLPTGYFHIVFTIPEELEPIALRNQKVVYNILFRAVSETLLKLSKDKKYLGAQTGFIAILHTWGQNLMSHTHMHCIVPAGGLSFDCSEWVSVKKTKKNDFFIHVNILSDLFKKKFLNYIKDAYNSSQLKLHGEIKYLEESHLFNCFNSKLYEKRWNVYCKPPFQNVEHVLEYLGRYTHRVAISNNRIVNLQDKKVTFKWRDYKENSKEKLMTITAEEFIRRFLTHVLPHRFVKIRHYGILSNKNRNTKLKKCTSILGVVIEKDKVKLTVSEFLLKLTGTDIAYVPAAIKAK